jgi:SsrA-binding protein
MESMAVKMVTTNKQARRNYDISETFEAGIALRGSEVKSLRESKVQLNDAYARFENGELWLLGLHIAPYVRASTHQRYEPTRKRKLLMHRAELDRLFSRTEQDHLTLVPMALYFKDNRAKLELGLGRGRKTVDKRQLIAKRDADREARRELAARSRR